MRKKDSEREGPKESESSRTGKKTKRQQRVNKAYSGREGVPQKKREFPKRQSEGQPHPKKREGKSMITFTGGLERRGERGPGGDLKRSKGVSEFSK